MNEWLKILKEQGFVYIENKDEDFLNEILNILGEVIMVTAVKINPKSRSLVTSTRGLDFHTDHHKANFIVWYCFNQTDEGGETIILDAEKVYQKLTKEEQEMLLKINLYEHKVFPDDTESTSLVYYDNEQKRHFYYSFWIVNEKDEKNKALMKFKEIIEMSEFVKIKLKPKDILIVNNHRVFHGRTEIKGNQDRFLKRYWIKSNVKPIN